MVDPFTYLSSTISSSLSRNKYQNRESSRSHGQAEQVRMEQLSAENTKLRVYEACVLSTAVVLQTLVVQAPHLKQLVWKL